MTASGSNHGVRRVLVIENHTLLSAGLLKLLKQQAGVLAEGAPGTNGTDLIQIIEVFKPDVLLFDADEHRAVVAALLYSGVYNSALLALQMTPEHTTALRYERRPVEIASVADLVELISTT